LTFEIKVNWEKELPNIRRLGEEGKTMQQIARIYGCSRQRIKQILDREIPEWTETYGKVIRDKKARKEFEKLQEWRKRKWGTEDKTTVEDLYWIQRTKFKAKRSNARNIGDKWEIEFGDIEWPTHCPILGMELNYYAQGNRVESSPSFDQIMPGRGYVVGNVQIISWRANRLKNNGTWEEHLKIAEYMKNLEQGSCVPEYIVV
jgi:hypothetical protein